jgi:nucleotide-binding universal stress UspA family protein
MSISAAVEDFQRAHLKAITQEVLAKATGKSTDLLSYDAVRKELKLHHTAIDRGLHEIPLDAIIGSAGRYEDFTKNFFPKRTSDEGRWARVKVAVESLTGVPPIEVYKVDQVYFVIDGNHRVSIARQMDSPAVQAYVKEIDVNVSLTPDMEPEDLILIAEQSDFFRQTKLNKSRPEIDFTLTATGMYAKLLEHIHTHRYFMGIDQGRSVEWDEGVTHWTDNTYKPVFDVIQQQGLLRKFPDRTPADMYLWLMEYHNKLEKELGWRLSSHQVAANLSSRFSNSFLDTFLRFRTWLFDILTPDKLESGPAIGSWRKQIKEIRGTNTNLFTNILVPIKNPETYWIALEQAILFAKREDANLLGLYIQPPNEPFDQEICVTLENRFLTRCNEVGVSGDFASEVGDPARKIVDRSQWTDLIVANFASHSMTEISSKSRAARQTMLRRSGRPLLAACETPSQMRSPLLAFDGSEKAKEALYVAAYMAKKHHLPLVVVSAVINDQQVSSIQHEARRYLNTHQIKATYVVEKGGAVEVIQKTADTFDCDLLILGSYGFKPLVEIVLGSTVDRLLAKGDRPLLICR